MDEKQVALIKKALNDTAAHLRAGSAGAKSVRNSALSLILAEEHERQPLSSMSEAELADLTKFNKRLVDIAARFLGQTMELPLTPEQTAQAQQLQQRIREAKADLDAGRSELARLNAELARISADCAVQSAANESLSSQVEQKRTAYLQLKDTEKDRRADLVTYSDDVIQAQQDKNATLAREVADRQSRLRELEGQYAVLDEQCRREQARIEDQQHKLDDLQARVDAQPEELRRLEEDYTALDAKLTRIQTAAEDCSEERQAELRAQIEALEPEVNALVAKHGELSAALEKLNAAHASELEETSQAEEALLASMNEAVDTLGEHCGALAEKLRAAMARSQQFEENLRLCRDNYDRFRSWLDSDAPALRAMCAKAGLSDKDYRTLFETLDAARCDEVRRLMEETEAHLTRLDQILSAGITSAQQDQSHTRTRAEVGDIQTDRD